MLVIHAGKHGLVYAYDHEVPGLLAAADSEDAVRALAAQGEKLLKTGQPIAIRNHMLLRHHSGVPMIMPTSNWQTDAQREETMRHIEMVTLAAIPPQGHC